MGSAASLATLVVAAIVAAFTLFRARKYMATRGVLVAALTVQVLWSVGLDNAEQWSAVELIGVEWLRMALWALVVNVLLLPLYQRDGSSHKMLAIAAIIGVVLVVAGGYLLQSDVSDAQAIQIWAFVSLALAAVGLFLAEQLYRFSAPQTRRTVRLLCLGLGGLFVTDILLYGQTLLIKQIDLALLTGRVWLNLPFVALLVPALYSLGRGAQSSLFVSREVVFYTVSLSALGIYILGMSVGGYWLQSQGVPWTTATQLLYAAAAVVLLFVVLFSWQWRRRLRIFIAKNFFRNRYDYRAEWLRFIDTLTTSDATQPLAERIVVAIGNIVDSPGGALWANDEGQYRLTGHVGDNEGQPAVIDSADDLIGFLARTQWIIDSRQYDSDPSNYDNVPLGLGRFTGEANYVVPLLHNDDLVGLCVLRQPVTTQPLNYEDHDLLKTVGKQVATYLLQERTSELLSEARQFEAFNKFSAFVMHDIKNLTAQLSLVVQNAEKHRGNQAFFDDAMHTIRNSVARMERLLRTLNRTEAQVSKVRVAALCQEAVNRMVGSAPEPTLAASAEDAARLQISVDFEQAVTVLCHLLRNAQDAAGADGGNVELGYHREGGFARITVRDNGIGMTKEFIETRLFRPFDSTKGAKGMGIGAYQARQFARSLNGDLLVESNPGEGTLIIVELPALEAEPD